MEGRGEERREGMEAGRGWEGMRGSGRGRGRELRGWGGDV